MKQFLKTTLVAVWLIPTPVVAQTTLPEAELTALKYYVSQGDQRSATAELNRLRARFPTWEPPQDLANLGRAAPSVSVPQEDANRVWRLIEIGNLQAARGRLTHLQSVYPEWEPPAEMVRLLTEAETQAEFDTAIKAGEASRVIDIVQRMPSILRCDRVNNAWQLAQMQVKAGLKADALQTYRGVLGSCSDTGVLVATLQKADGIASGEEIRQLIDYAKSARPTALNSIASVEERLMAGRGQGSEPAKPATAPRKAAAATPRQSAPQTAAPAPRRATQPRRSGPLPLSGDPRLAQVRAAAKAGAWSRCLAASANPRSVDVLYERGWCAYNHDRPLEALAAFRVAASAGMEPTVERDAKFGMILSFLDNQMTEDAARQAAVTDLTPNQRQDVESVILDQRGVRAFQQGRYQDAVTYLNALQRQSGSIRRDLAIMRAYAYLNLGDRVTARAQFEELHNQLATNDTRRGLRAAMN